MLQTAEGPVNLSNLRSRLTADLDDHETWLMWTEDGLTLEQIAAEEGVKPCMVRKSIRRHRKRFGLTPRQPCTIEHPDPRGVSDAG